MKGLLLILVCALMMGCIHKPRPIHTLPPCLQHCVLQTKHCLQHCHNDSARCRMASKQQSQNSFCRYQQEEIIKGGEVVRKPEAYQDPLKCRKVTCNCRADHQVCAEACTGIIHKRLQVASIC